MKEALKDLPAGINSCLEEWTTEGTVAFALMGSYARGDAGPHSDVDIMRLVNDDKQAAEAQSFLIGGNEGESDSWAANSSRQRQFLVVHSTVTPSQVESWFTEPDQAVNIIVGLRDGRALWDPTNVFASVQQRAHNFVWTQSHQEKANRLAGKELVGWIEEAHKGLEGLRRNDTGRLLNARFGLSWGLAWVMRVQKGVLSASDNTFYDDVISVVGPASRWAWLLRRAFGTAIEGENASLSLREVVQAGLLLYCETFELLKEALSPDDYRLIAATVQRIRTGLEGDESVVRLDPGSSPIPS